jgi:hypothetical protein
MGSASDDLRARATHLREQATDLRQGADGICHEELIALAWGCEHMARQLEALMRPKQDLGAEATTARR